MQAAQCAVGSDSISRAVALGPQRRDPLGRGRRRAGRAGRDRRASEVRGSDRHRRQPFTNRSMPLVEQRAIRGLRPRPSSSTCRGASASGARQTPPVAARTRARRRRCRLGRAADQHRQRGHRAPAARRASVKARSQRARPGRRSAASCPAQRLLRGRCGVEGLAGDVGVLDLQPRKGANRLARPASGSPR